MDKIQALKKTDKNIQRGTISASLERKSASQRRAIKATEYAKIRVPNDRFEIGPYKVTIIDGPKKISDDIVELSVHATRNNSVVKVDNPLQFINPPIMVPDGTYYEETITDVTGKEITLKKQNFKEDPEQALQIIVAQVLDKFKLAPGQ